jgi:hypothetical protein
MPIITYPGITGVVHLDATFSMGITPAAIGLVCQSDSAPDITGNLVIGDGTNANVTLVNCRRDYTEQVTEPGVDHLLVRLLDRRWTWREGFPVTGHFNQLSNAKKLIPWRVRSPYQLARILLAQLGEYTLTATVPVSVIDLPGGLAAPPAAGVVPGLNPGYSMAVKAATWAAGTATIVTAVDHEFATNQYIVVSGVSPAGYNGTFQITVTGPNTFTYALGTSPGTGGGGTAAGVAVTAATWAGGVATIMTGAPHGLAVGNPVIVTGVSPTGYNGAFFVGSVISPAQFTYALPVDPGAFAYGGACDFDLTLILGGMPVNASIQIDKVIDPPSEYLGLGQNLPTSRTNPLEMWESQPAALILANLCEKYGRAVVWDPITDRVRIVRFGNGIELPPGGVWNSNGVSVTGEAIPTAVTIRGAPTRFDYRIRLRHVNEEWDGSWVLPGRVSYSPTRAGQTMIVWIEGSYNAAWSYSVTINGVAFTVAAGAQASFPAVVTAIAAAINASADPRIAGMISASAVTGAAPIRLAITAAAAGYEFELVTDGSTAPKFPGPTFPAYVPGWYATCKVGPILPGAVQQQAQTVDFGSYAPGDLYTVTIAGNTFNNTGLETDQPAALQNLADSANLLKLVTHVVATAGGNILALTCDSPGVAFLLTASTTGVGPTVITEVSPTIALGKGWEKTAGDFGAFANPTSQLNKPQAAEKANKSVFRTYQIVGVSPADETVRAIPTPGYTVGGIPLADGGTAIASISNRFRVMLQSSRPQPIRPAPGDANVIDNKTGQPFAAEVYNGFSVDRPNIAYGSVYHGVIENTGLRLTNATYFQNTPKRSYLPISFDVIDIERGVIQFSRPVFRILGQSAGGTVGAAAENAAGWPIPGVNGYACLESDIVIQCGCEILDDPSGVPSRYSYTLAIGGFAPAIERVYSDVQLEVLGQYDANHGVTGSAILDDDAENRASYYARAIANAYQLPDGIGRTYEGILSIPLDGKTRQLQWTIGAEGCASQVSSNSEFSRVIIPYQMRRRAENLAQDPERERQNLKSDFGMRGAADNAVRRRQAGFGASGGAK